MNEPEPKFGPISFAVPEKMSQTFLSVSLILEGEAGRTMGGPITTVGWMVVIANEG